MGAETGNKRRLVVASLTGILLFVALVWYASPSRIIDTLRAADYRLIILVWAARILVTVARTFRFALFVNVRGNLLRAYAVFSVARLLNMAMPFRTGDLAMLAILKRAQLTPSIAHLVPVWLLLRITDALALAVWFCAAVTLSTIGREYLAAGISIVFVALGALFFLHYAVDLVPARMLGNRDNWWVGRFAALVDGLRAVDGTSKRVFAALTSMLIWGLLLCSATLSQIAFSTPLDLQSAFLAAVFVFAFSVIPVNAPLGIGTGEIIWIAAMSLVGVPLEVAVPLAIGVRIAALSILLIEGSLGGLLMLLLPRSGGASVGDAKTAQ